VSSLFAREVIPSPLVLEAVVITDVLARSVAVRLPETAIGGSRMWWKTAHTALKAAVENGWANHPFVWASTPSVSDVVHVQPADFGMLSATFPVGTAGFSELVSQPVYALATIDRNKGRFTRVKFLHGRAA
jgi:hypothetical protein